MNLDKAIEKVGKKMGNNKFHHYMGGSMVPSGELTVAEVIATLYDISHEQAAAMLRRAEKSEFNRILKKELEKSK